MVTETIEHALPAASRLISLGPGAASSVDDIAPDFKRVLYALSELQSRADSMTSVIMSKMSIEDTRRGLAESHSLARLTWLATIFIPLSWVTGLFSMTDDLATMKDTFGWYFAAALPLTTFCLAFAWAASRGWFGFQAFRTRRIHVASR
jgi:Mg2+ and Co2+ transporter CorA